MILRKNNLKKAVSSILVSAMVISFGACSLNSNSSQDNYSQGNKKYSLENIKLTETERSWSNPEEKYAELVKLYGGSVCPGTMVVASN